MIASIIIATKNRCGSLQATLHSFEAVHVPAGLVVELLIMDNGSTDGTAAVVKSARLADFELKYVLESRGGKAVALNSALKIACGEIIVLSDDDVRPSPAWLKCITQPIAEGKYDALAGKVSIAPQLSRAWMGKMHLGWLASTDYLDPVAPDRAVGANMSFSRRVLERVYGFDAELGPGALGLWEDTLFSLQLREAGFRLGNASDASVVHHFDPSRLSRAAFLGRARAEGKSSAYVAWHWRHDIRSGCMARIANCNIHLLLKRMLRWKDWHRTEGVAEWEMYLVGGIAFERHFLFESGRPHAYDKRGSRKLCVPQ